MRGARTRNIAIAAGAGLAALALVVVVVLVAIGWPAGRQHVALVVPIPPQPTPTSTARPRPSTSAGVGPLAKLTRTVLVPGNGPAVHAGQELTVHYLLVSYTTGEELDSSWARGQPFTFTLGAGAVIQGWEQGLPGANLGSRIQLDVPASLAYGENNSNVSGPLRFIVDLLAAS